MKSVVSFLVIVLVLAGGYYYYTHFYRPQKDLAEGEVTCTGCLTPGQHAEFLKENSGESADGNSERKTASARVAAEEATTTSPVTGTSSMVAPTPSAYDGATAANQPPVIVPTTGQPDATPAGIPPAVAAGLPVADSVPANPSNGARFAGSGSYQWYRQGNLTWRVDTTTGRSCIVYATMEEWRKQIVMSHGCGKDA